MQDGQIIFNYACTYMISHFWGISKAEPYIGPRDGYWSEDVDGHGYRNPGTFAVSMQLGETQNAS